MMEYDPSKKLFLVKRVHVPNHVLEAAHRKREESLGSEGVSEKKDEVKGELILFH